MRDVFELTTRKGSDPVINSDMTVELQSLSTQLYYMLVMTLSDQALVIVLNSKELVKECGASCSGSTNLALVSGTEQCCNRC